MKTDQKIALAIILTTVIFLTINSAFSANINVNPGQKIQDAIDSSAEGDTIQVNDNGNEQPATYTENININKKGLTVQSKGAVTINAKDKNTPIVVIDQDGSQSTLKGFKISGATGDYGCGVYINNAQGVKVINNEIKNNKNGIVVEGYNNAVIYGNNIHHNTNDGIVYYKPGLFGVKNSIPTHNEVMIETNNILNNKRNGITVYEYYNHVGALAKYKSSSTPGPLPQIYITVKFNRITGNGEYGLAYNYQAPQLFLANQINGNNQYKVVAINNWWGYDTLADVKKQINAPNNYVQWNPYIVLKLTPKQVKIKAGQSVAIIAYLIYNSNNQDTSSLGGLPEFIPIFFTTNFGEIGSQTKWVETKDGKAQVILTATRKGTATISASADNAIKYTQVNVEAATETVQNKTISVSGQTVAMQPTGIPLVGLILALLMIAGGIVFKK